MEQLATKLKDIKSKYTFKKKISETICLTRVRCEVYFTFEF